MTKTFKIGEYAIGGIIQVDIKRNIIEIKALDWNTKEVVSLNTFDCLEQWTVNYTWQILEYLEDLTTYYYAQRILTWIKKNL